MGDGKRERKIRTGVAKIPNLVSACRALDMGPAKLWGMEWGGGSISYGWVELCPSSVSRMTSLFSPAARGEMVPNPMLT